MTPRPIFPATESELPVEPSVLLVDIPLMAGVALLGVPVFVTEKLVSRLGGTLFVASYLAYMTSLVVLRT